MRFVVLELATIRDIVADVDSLPVSPACFSKALEVVAVGSNESTLTSGHSFCKLSFE